MNALLLLLLDSRAPAGAHHHSGGMEAAVRAGLVRGPADLEDFCRAKLRTSARVSASFAAAACGLTGAERTGSPAPWQDRAQREWVQREWVQREWVQREWVQREWVQREWALLDAEFGARTPSEATRTASRQLGRGLLRLFRSVIPEADLVTPWSLCPGPAPHHPLVLGAGVSLAGGTPELAARAAALAACAGPASAAVRLLGLDPFAVQAMLARLAPGVDECAAFAARCAAECAAGAPSALPTDGAPALDLLADYHLTAEVRLFAS
jgi:urease accessory protein